MSALMRRLERFVPEQWEGEQRLRARMAMALPIPLVVLGWGLSLVHFLVGSRAAALVCFVAGLLGVGTSALIPWTRSLRLTVYVQLATTLSTIFAVAWLMGGMLGPAIFALLMVPMLAGTLMGRRAAMAWGAIAAAAMVALFLLTEVGLVPPTPFGLDDLPRLNTLAGVLTMGLFVVMALAVEAMRSDRIRRLEDASLRADAATRAKSDFLANMSHEIRTPLHGLLGTLELLGDTVLSNEQHELLTTASGSSQSLLGIVNEILDHSKIEAGHLSLQMETIDLVACVEDAVTSLAPLAEDNGLELVLDLERSLPRRVRADGQRLRQVLCNLVGNALKFTPEGHVLVRVRCAQSAGQVRHVRFEIHDTGKGIAEAQQDRLFRPFEQGDSTLVRKHSGTGLGLAISASLTELMGGTLRLDSRLGEGSCFSFALDLRAVLSSAPGADPRIDRRDALVVGGSPVANAMLHRILTAAGVDEVATFDTWSGDQLAEVRRYDLLIADAEAMTGALLEETLAEASRYSVPAVVIGKVPLEGPELDGVPRVAKPVLRASLLRAIFDAVSTEERTDRITKSCRRPRLSRGIILMADDNPVNRRVTAAFLMQAGFGCDMVADGEAALDKLEEEPNRYAAVLMDCHMPVLDGYEATREFRRRELTGARLPIIALTADAMPNTRERALTAGMDEYLAKPFRREQLVAVLTKYCA